MAIHVLVSDNCLADAKQHGLVDEVERFRERVEATQSTSAFDRFPPPYLVKKKLGGRQGRLVADARPMGEHVVIVFLAVLIRGSREYESFSSAPQEYGRQRFSSVVSDEFVGETLALRTKSAAPPERPTPGDAEYGFLFGAFAHHDGSKADDLICETKEWVEAVAQDRIAKQLALFCEPCLQALSKEPGLHFLPVAAKLRWGVWALRAPGRLLLIVPATDTTEAESRALAERVAAELSEADPSAILRASRRAYPALVLADDELWLDLEKEPVANMALSPEESEVLESARTAEHRFPLFINGRAGSGKSTILQYLFADLLFYYLSNPEARDAMAPPVYLTASGELLRVARGFVERLLKSGANFSHRLPGGLPEGSQDVLDSAFREYQPHLLSLLPIADRLERYSASSRVDFPRFQRMWNLRFGKDMKALREFGPGVSWHVVRTYIKGLSSETYLEPEDYRQLPDNQLTVAADVFDKVFERVWAAWYRPTLEEQGLWDDQDLTRAILEKDLARPHYPAVFCDEAQDFTRLELELLLRLNLFSDRAVPAEQVGYVPFAFAGDQFQTLNPTGFRWDAIKTSFVEKFLFALDPSMRSGRVDLNYRELQYNYRSTEKIVRFGNLVQALRAALFGLTDLRPQMPWTTAARPFQVSWFRDDDAEFWKQFRENPGLVVLVPCGEGEEANYVENEPALEAHVRVDDGVPVNVLSAGRAKGCEYPAVVVYGFGAACQHDVLEMLRREKVEGDEDVNESLPMQYFINRLYVAVSRPKQRLIVVDSDAGFRRLWRFAQDERIEAEVISSIRNGSEVWGEQVEGMTVGKPGELTRESAGDPLENARAFEADGMARQDAFLLRQAAQAYRSSNDHAKARECRARAYEAEQEFLKAGESFFDAGFGNSDGIRCLWRAGESGWASLTDRAKANPQLNDELEVEWARAIVERAGLDRVADVLTRFLRRLSEADYRARCQGEAIWPAALAALLRTSAAREAAESPSQATLHRIASALADLEEVGLEIPASEAATIFFRVGRFREAVRLWEKAGETRSKDYYRAKASIEPYPERVLSLAGLGLHSDLVDAYMGAPNSPLSPEQAASVAVALVSANRCDEAIDVAWRWADARTMQEVAAALIGAGMKEAAGRALFAAIILLVRGDRWDAIVEFTSGSKNPELSLRAWPAGIRGELQRYRPQLEVALVQALARSEGLAVSDQSIQKALATWLKKYLEAQVPFGRLGLTVREAGAALERTGRFVEAVSFYAGVIEGPHSEEDKKYASLRWLACKERQLSHEQSKPNTAKARDTEREIRRARATLRIPEGTRLEVLPRLPPIDLGALLSPAKSQVTLVVTEPPEHPSELGDHAQFVLGDIKVEVSRPAKRCNLTNLTTMTTAFVKVAENRCGGEASFVRVGEDRWAAADWGIVVDLSGRAAGSLSIESGALGLVVRVAV